MSKKKENVLIVIENGQLSTYALDDKLIWEIGRPSKDNLPDIQLHSTTVSRHHGRIQNQDGVWFYLDKKGKNGTVYNGKHITTGIRGRIKPISLQDGDVLIFGGGDQAVINYKTIWTMFSEETYDERWRIEDTKAWTTLIFSDGHTETRLETPQKGMVIKQENGMAIYMGDITYLAGEIAVNGK